MGNGFKVLFYIRKTKVNREGKVPIYFRVTIEGRRFETTTTRYIEPANWSQEAERVLGKRTDKDLLYTNEHLELMRSRVTSIQRKLMMLEVPMSYEAFMNEWLNVKEAPKMLVPIFEEHNSQVKQLIDHEYSFATWKRYNTSLRHTRNFLKEKYGVLDIAIKKLDYKFITDYEFWLKVTRKCNHNSAIKYLSNFRKVVNICVQNGWLEKDPFAGFKMAKKQVERQFLTAEEIKSIHDKHFSMERLAQVRDIFLFCCYTRLAYVDIQKLTRDEIVTGVDGEKWIFTHREKTESVSKIPLLQPALEILERYKGNQECIIKNKVLPVPTNQKMNAYLKEIADVCGIKKYLTTHLARHTFATTVTLTNGVPMETVSKMLGHRNLRTTQHYAKILDMKVAEDMKALREKMRMGESGENQ
jgi:site-specific recombinase XerD